MNFVLSVPHSAMAPTVLADSSFHSNRTDWKNLWFGRDPPVHSALAAQMDGFAPKGFSDQIFPVFAMVRIGFPGLALLLNSIAPTDGIDRPALTGRLGPAVRAVRYFVS